MPYFQRALANERLKKVHKYNITSFELCLNYLLFVVPLCYLTMSYKYRFNLLISIWCSWFDYSTLLLSDNEFALQIDKAISDYGICILIDENYAPSYFNRSGLYQMQGHIPRSHLLWCVVIVNSNHLNEIKGLYELALNDLDTAIKLDPTNLDYRTNRTLGMEFFLLRCQGWC
jgi:tetratricopeptide (TPR) repeat protein